MLKSIFQMLKLNLDNIDASKAEVIRSNTTGTYLLQADGLSSGYTKNDPIIRDLSFSIMPGEILGLIGSNGAGKSTTMKAITGLLTVFKGEVNIPDKEQGGYAYIPELPALYEELTLWEHMEIMAMANNMGSNVFAERGNELLRQFNMEKYKYNSPGVFSKGMRQKVMILCSCLLEPQLYLVDEPFNGLDPHTIKNLLDLFLREKSRGAGILISTHVLDIAERICDRILIIDNGQIIAQGNLAQLRTQVHLPAGNLFDIYDKLLEGDGQFVC